MKRKKNNKMEKVFEKTINCKSQELPVFPYPPTKEQEVIFDAALNSNDNLLIEARAGASKTTTIIHIAKLLPKNKSKIFLAFNRHIKEELTLKLPEDVKCYTSHGLGMMAIKRKYGDKITMDEFKISKIIEKKSETWNLERDFTIDQIPDYKSSIRKMVDLCRLTMTFDKKYVEYIAEKYDIVYSEPLDIKRVLSVLDSAMEDRTTFDFIDMIFLPAVDKTIWVQQFDYIFIDEAQDMSRAQQELVKRLVKRDMFNNYVGRTIVVGDEKQSIYSFAGSDHKSFAWFRKFNNPKILPLTTTFRCAKKIVEHAQQLVPDIMPRENAPDGVVMKGSVYDAKDGDFVLCRTTAPLVVLFFELLAQGKKVTIKGSDIGLSLLDMIKKYKSLSTMSAGLYNELIQMQGILRKKGITKFHECSAYVNFIDKVEVLNFMAKQVNDIEELRKKIQSIFTENVSGIVLSTIHKAKGLEAERVFIIRPDQLPMRVSKAWMAEQEKNLIYVAMTRAKNELIYDYEWTNVKDDE